MRRLLLLVVPTAVAMQWASAQDKQTDPAETWTPAVESVLVEAGDTLWDICGRVVGKPWEWPRVWSFNPEITNPHWIYPGQTIRMVPSPYPLPALDSVSPDAALIAAKLAPKKHPPIEVINARPTHVGPPGTRYVLAGSFVTDQELAESGTIYGSEYDRELLQPGDLVYAKFPEDKKPGPGRRYLAYITERPIVHPITGQAFGYMTRIAGFLTTLAPTARKLSEARITQTMLEVERGQRLTELTEEPLFYVRPTFAESIVEGYVLALDAQAEIMVATHQMAFVDRGTDDGLRVGNQLKIWERVDPIRAQELDVEPRDVGTLMVIAARPRVSTCVITRATREILPGDPVRTLVALGLMQHKLSEPAQAH